MIDSAPTEAWQTPASSENQVVYWFLVGKFSYILLTTRLIPKAHRLRSRYLGQHESYGSYLLFDALICISLRIKSANIFTCIIACHAEPWSFHRDTLLHHIGRGSAVGNGVYLLAMD